MLNKRLIILVSVIIGILIITSLALWFLFKSPATQTEKTQTTSEDETSTPITQTEEGELTVFKLSDVAVSSPVISGNNVLYYSKETGNVLSTDLQGESTKSVTNFRIPDIITNIWSPDKAKVINIYKENDSIKKVLYDFSSNKAIPLDSRIKFVNFSTSQNRIVYQFIDSRLGINKISISDPDGLNWKTLQNIRMENVRLFWPKQDLIAILTAPSGLVKGSLLTTNANGGSLVRVLSDLFGLTVQYSSDGSFLLYSTTDQSGHSPSLHLLKEGDTNPQNLQINTISDKCAFSQNNNIYCAIPSITNGSLVLPDDFYKNIANFSDSFFKIDTLNNRSFSLFDSSFIRGLGYDFNVSELVISPDEDYLIFVNKKDGLLYSIKIK